MLHKFVHDLFEHMYSSLVISNDVEQLMIGLNRHEYSIMNVVLEPDRFILFASYPWSFQNLIWW